MLILPLLNLFFLRPWDAKKKGNSIWIPSNGTYWPSDVVMTGIHPLMDEVESKARLVQQRQGGRSIRFGQQPWSIPGHLDNRDVRTLEGMLDYQSHYIATFEEALKKDNSADFLDHAMDDHVDDSLPFLLDWSMDRYYFSKRKTPLPLP